MRRVALQAARFRLRDVKTDVLKGLYESLVDPEQRHDLGEYYTPNWLAASMCERAIERPLDQRVLDPACGSGTFLFHAVRRLMDGAEAAGLTILEALTRACGQVFGVDVHPVAVQFARVTFLLALGVARLRRRPARLNIPVYLGDSLQIWGFVTRNLVRPVWLSQEEQRADVVIGNPPGCPTASWRGRHSGAFGKSASAAASGPAEGSPRSKTCLPTSSPVASSCTLSRGVSLRSSCHTPP